MNRILISSATCLALMTGCASLDGDWKKHLPWQGDKRLTEAKAEGPATMVAIWTPDILSQTGKPPTRGFGGRLYFYDKANHAIPVEGQLIVFAYDDSKPDHPDSDPERKYAFTPEQFKRHYSESEIGASYSIWVPWDAVGGERKNITLVPIFTSSSGQLVIGEQAKNVLPGRTSKPTDVPQLPEAAVANSIQPVAHFDSQQLNAASNGVLRTSTIQLPKSLQSRLKQSAPQSLLNRPVGTPLPPTDESWGAIQTSSQTIRELAQPIQTGATGQFPTELPAVAPPAVKQPRRPQSARFVHSKHRVQAEQGVSAYAAGGQ